MELGGRKGEGLVPQVFSVVYGLCPFEELEKEMELEEEEELVEEELYILAHSQRWKSWGKHFRNV